MATYTGTFSGRSQYKIQLNVSQGAQSIPGNYTTVHWSIYIIESPNWGSFTSDPSYWSVNIGGHTSSGSFPSYNFNNYDSLFIASGSFNVAHNADGTAAIWNSASISAAGPLGSASASGSLGLSTIPRASTPTFTVGGVAATSVDAGQLVTINTNRASTGFTHTIAYSFGTQSGTIASGVTDSTTWTPPLSLLSEIPNASSGAMQITTTTFSGATNVGSKVVTLTLKVPSSVGPDFTTVTHAEATIAPDIAGLIGAYVKDMSKLAVAITGAVGAYGSTVSSYKIEVAGQIINTQSGVTATLGQSGALTLRGTITDSRGSTKVKDITVNVLNYTNPAITTASAVRSTVGGTIDPNGTYIKVDLTAVTQSLIVGTQKNNLTYKIKTRSNGDTTPWTSITPVASATVATTGYDDDNIIGTYSISDSFTVRIEVTDKLGSLSVIELTVSTGGTLLHFSHTEDGVGVGKYHEQGSIDALGQMYQNNGKAVADIPTVESLLASALETYGSLPAGTVLAFSGTTLPANSLWAEGQAVSRTDYATLYASIGTQYGVGDGATTFNVPDLRGRVPVGLDLLQTEFNAPGKAGGAKTHVLTIAEMPSHTHNFDGNITNYTGGIAAGINFGGGSVSHPGYSSGIVAAGGGGAHNILQPYRVFRYIITTSNATLASDSALSVRMGAAEGRIEALEMVSGSQIAAFQAQGTTNVGKSGAQFYSKFVFGQAHLNIGNRYNTTTGEFTAAIAGVYRFDFSFAATQASGGPEAAIYKNGTLLYGTMAIGYGVAYNTFGSSAVVSLNAGDTISVWWNNNNNVTTNIDGTRSFFSGHLIGKA